MRSWTSLRTAMTNMNARYTTKRTMEALTKT
jgi:hypothetical protein